MMLKSGRTERGTPYLYYEVNVKFKDDKMTNELGTTLSDIEAKADRKRDLLNKLNDVLERKNDCPLYMNEWQYLYQIRKYIEES